MRAAYSQGPAALLQDALRQSADESLATLELSHFPTAVCQLLLYIQSTVENLSKLPKGTGVSVVGRLMEVLQAVVLKLQESETAEPEAAEGQEGEELFLDTTSGGQDNKDEVLLTVLKTIFKHPCLEQWFFALELGTLPAHSLNPVQLKALCAQVSDSILSLLQAAVVTLSQVGALDLIGGYISAVQRALVKELEEVAEKPDAKRHAKDSLALKALLALHKHMEVAGLKEAVSALLLLPKESLVVATVATGDGDVIKEESRPQLSAYGAAALRVLTESPSQDGALYLSRAHLGGLATLLTSCRSAALEDFFLQALTADPGSAKLVRTDVLLYCTRPGGGADDGSSTQAVGSLLLQNCSTQRLRFERWCLETPGLGEEVMRNQGLLTLLSAYLKVAAREDPTRPSEVRAAVLTALQRTLLAPLWSTMLGAEAGETLGLLVEVLSNLIKLATKASDVLTLMPDLTASLQKPQSFERWQLADAISAKLEDSPEALESWRKSQLKAALRWLIASYSSCKETESAHLDQEEAILQRLEELVKISQEHVAVTDWNSFVKSGLKHRYRHHALLNTLTSLVELLYGDSDPPKGLLPLATIHMMSSSHSLFLPSMLGSEEELCSSPQVKEALISLSLALVKKCPSVCEMRHFVVLMGAYGATLSTADQKLLLLLQEYEKNGFSLMDFQCMLWGPAAVEHHKTRMSMGPSLWQQPSAEEMLVLLCPTRMQHTVSHFPQQRRIIPQEGKELIYKAEGDQDLTDLYDPCFLLPLFSAILRPECVIDCLKFVSCHALGVTVTSLSSYDPKLRAAAYQVLGSYYQHLEAARFKGKRQLLYLLDTVKNGIKQQNLRVPFVLTTYVAKVAQQMLRPEEHMYMVVNKFLLGHQYLDFKRVPEFFKLFYSSDLEHKVEREWMLSVLEEGVADRYCYELCDQQGLYHTLLGFCCSPLCDDSTQILIINVLRKTAHVTKGAYNLTKAHGLLTWLMQVLERRFVDPKLLSAIVDLAHTLWFTNLGQKESRAEESSSAAEEKDKPQAAVKCLPLPLINEFLCVLLSVIKHLKTAGVKAPQLKLFLQTLSSVLTHRGIALGVHSEAGWLTLKAQLLSSLDILSLLHRWGTLARDTALLNTLQGLATACQLKDVFGAGRERGRGKSSTHQQALRSRMEEQADTDGESEKRDQSLLEECKPLLRNIFTHWEPAPQTLPVPSTAPQTDSEVPQTKRLEPVCMSHSTASLLIKWTLRTLALATYDSSSVLSFLKWVHTVALPHKGVIDALMADMAVKIDFLRLYHQACECGDPAQCSSREETLSLFTSIMLQLLEAQGVPMGPLHQTVVTTCLPKSTDDHTGREAGLLLLSLYIHELWSGVESAELFLTHVKLVTLDQGEKSKSNVVDICREILTVLESSMST